MKIKPGILTSELWLIIAAAAEATTKTLSSNQHVNYATLGAAVLYAVCRTIVKFGS